MYASLSKYTYQLYSFIIITSPPESIQQTQKIFPKAHLQSTTYFLINFNT